MIMRYLVLFQIFFQIWLSRCVSGAPSGQDDYNSTITISGGIISLIFIPVILFTTAVCCLKQKSSSKVLFTKHEGTFKVTIDPSSNNEGPFKVCSSRVLFTKHEGTFKVIIDPSSNDEGPFKVAPFSVYVKDKDNNRIKTCDVPEESQNSNTPKESVHHNQPLKSSNNYEMPTRRSKMNNYVTSIDSVTFTHNPSYSVSKLNEGLTDSLYVDCSRFSEFPTDKVAEETPFKKQEVVAECENALYEARECKNALYEARESENTLYEARECENTLYEARECENTLYEARESENALYEAREYDNVSYARSVSVTPNPSYHTPLPRLSSQNSYDYVAHPISEDLTQQITNTDIGVNCNSTLYSMTLLEAATEEHGALYAVSDVPSTRSSMAILSRSSSQNSYEYIAAQTFEESTHDYSLVDAAVV